MATLYAAVPDKEDGQHATPMPTPLHYAPYPPQASEEGSNPTFLPIPARRKRRFELLELLKNVCLPLIAIAYFAFCYTVHTRIVPVRSTRPINLGEFDQTTIKSATTAISIIVITIGLFPIKSLIQDLKNEEFFRVLSSKPGGVPLSTVNNISTAAAGNSEAIRAIAARRSSNYFLAAFVAGLLTMVVTTLAPSALSVTNVLVDGDVMAFAVGAVPADSVLNVTDLDQLINGAGSRAVENNAELAGNIAWAEWLLGARYQYLNPGFNTSDGEMYIVPTPRDLPSTSYATWISDVIHLRPECFWARTNVSEAVNLGKTWLDLEFDDRFDVALENGLNVALSPRLIGESISLLIIFCLTHTLSAPPTGTYDVALEIQEPMSIVNATTLDAAPSGTTVWMLYQQTSPELSAAAAPIRYNLDGIPTFDVVGEDKTKRVAYLVCHPRATIEPGIIRSEAGKLSMEPTPPGLRRQGNLHVAQSNFLLSWGMKSIDDAGPKRVSSRIASSDMMSTIIFGGDNFARALNVSLGRDTISWTPVPVESITRSYASLLQSATKEYMGGMLGTQTVPARVATPTLIFTSSLPLTITAFIVFTLLCVLLTVAQFRKGKGDSFTFYTVAAALDGSTVPGQFSQAKKDGVELDEQRVGLGRGNSVLSKKKEEDRWEAEAARLGARPLVLERGPPGHMRLHLG